MSNNKLQDKKRKIREKTKAAKKTENRLFAARRARYERAVALEEKKTQEKVEPIRNKSHLDKIAEQLEHNVQILEALEEEYVTAMKSRENIHEELEAEGFNSIEEKFEALRKKSLELSEKLKENSLK